MSGHGCTIACGGICHLNAEAQAQYLDLILEERWAEADELRTRGVSA